MPETFTIKSRWGGSTLYEGAAETLKEATEKAVDRGADLRGAYLRGADLRGADLGGADLGGAYLLGAYLRGADLRGADLRGADLRGADLGGADLGGADLRGAYLGGADLGGADLGGAYLRGAYLRGADLRGAKLNWQSHGLLGEILFRAAGPDVGKRKAAGLIAISRDWCWGDFLRLDDPLKGWVLETLAGFVVDGDGAPAVIAAVAARRKAAQPSDVAATQAVAAIDDDTE